MDNPEQEISSLPKLAEQKRIPDRRFFSVEFPGHIENIEKAKELIGGDRAILNASASSPTTDGNSGALAKQ